MKLDFVKGHMGGNTIIFLNGAQIPKGRELEISLELLKKRYLGGDESTILYPPQGEGDLKVKISEPASGEFIGACGGMTQVLGKVLFETPVGASLGITARKPVTPVILETDNGLTEIEVSFSESRVEKVVTDMTSFVRKCYQHGVHPMEICGVKVMRVGEFMAVNGDRIKDVCPAADVEKLDAETRRILINVQKEFMEQTKEPYNITLYDWHPCYSGDLRAVFPHRIPDLIETSCGTGTVVLALAILESGEMDLSKLPFKESCRIRVECGGGADLIGEDITELTFILKDNKIENAYFTHNNVELTAQGWVEL
ncbi:conserved hypothetical protein [anaerobic digester metagenome]|jgi:diaminopimelate epimerase|uniref:Diaminopimelate epimerase n=1 Tax=anaerobic digester metagenome TaxID=1263854 RepID=A0A485M6B5_9ZZZZ